jgi:hypothetical protein
MQRKTDCLGTIVEDNRNVSMDALDKRGMLNGMPQVVT